MPNPKGNTNKCKSCHHLAGKDGWCKKHRPKPNQALNEKTYKLTRKSYKDYDGYFGQESFFENEEYQVTRDKFGIEEGW